MKSIKYIILIVALALGIFFSCSDEFLDTRPLGTVSEESFYTQMTSLDMATTSCYSIFSMEKIWDLTIVMIMGSATSDEAEAGGRDYADVPEFQAIARFEHNPSTPNAFEWTYGYLYRSINYCNVVIYRYFEDDATIAALQTQPDYSEKILKQRVAEARFLRAFNFFTLCQIFGGVPKVDHLLSPDEYNMPRSNIADIYSLIKSDLKLAVPDLVPKSELGDANIGRASKGAAQSLLAKVYLYESSYAANYPTDSRFAGLEEKWDSVNYWAEQVIASGEYALVGLNGERFDSWRDTTNGVGGFTHIFSPGANNCEESIFDIQSRLDGLGWFYSRGTALIRWCAPRRTNQPGSGVDGTEGPGWGWWIPSQQLVDSYIPGDIRYKATVLEETDSLLMEFADGLQWITPNYNQLRAAIGAHRNQRKYECSPGEYWSLSSNWKEGPTNVKMIRYADVLLMNAEAYFMRNMDAEALDNINLVRQRARMSGAGVEPAPLGSLTLQDIKNERLWELACEGHRFFDVIRWGNAEPVIEQPFPDGFVRDFVPGKHEFFPLPESEIIRSNGVLEQNPGY